jgi:hypothetical protein
MDLRAWIRVATVLLLALTLVGATGCKSSKKRKRSSSTKTRTEVCKDRKCGTCAGQGDYTCTACQGVQAEGACARCAGAGDLGQVCSRCKGTGGWCGLNACRQIQSYTPGPPGEKNPYCKHCGQACSDCRGYGWIQARRCPTCLDSTRPNRGTGKVPGQECYCKAQEQGLRVCDRCTQSWLVCKTCKGSRVQPCRSCLGSGQANVCTKCRGSGVLTHMVTVKVKASPRPRGYDDDDDRGGRSVFDKFDFDD